ncbi:unnamed protein product [Rhodiola kirilowii]
MIGGDEPGMASKAAATTLQGKWYIHITAYSPLGAPGTKWGDNRVLNSDVVLQQIAKVKGKTVAQISMRWLYEQGVSVIPKSFNKERMRNNIEIFDWSLTEEELHKIDQIPQHKCVLFVNNLGPTKFALWSLTYVSPKKCHTFISCRVTYGLDSLQCFNMPDLKSYRSTLQCSCISSK